MHPLVWLFVLSAASKSKKATPTAKPAAIQKSVIGGALRPMPLAEIRRRRGIRRAFPS